MTRSSLTLALMTLLSNPANATTTFYNITGVSQFINTTTTTPQTGSTTPTTTGTIMAYGGLGGLYASSNALFTTSTTDTVNNCAAANATGCIPTDTGDTDTASEANLCSCATAMVSDNLLITVILNRSVSTGLVYAAFTTLTAPTGTGTSGTAATMLPNQTSTSTTVAFPWTSICGYAVNSNTAGGSCTVAGLTTQNVAITVWADNDASGPNTITTGDDTIPITFTPVITPQGGASATSSIDSVYGHGYSEGIGSFQAYPGDGRIYLYQANTASGFPQISSSGTAAYAVRVYVSTQSLDSAYEGSPSLAVPAKNIMVDSSGNLSQLYIDGLTNGTQYYVRVALLDMGLNVVQYFPDLTANLDATTSAACTASPPTNCPYAVIPNQVLGILSKDVNCFVATAAFGSSLEPKLKVLRTFRNLVLLRSDWGQKLVVGYYRYGPIAARWIQPRPWAKAAVRTLLWPALGFSWVAITYGLNTALAALGFGLALVLASAVWLFKRRMARA